MASLLQDIVLEKDLATITSFEELECWKDARILCFEIGKLITDQRFGKNFSLISQIERSSGSIMDNIAEGFNRGSRKDFISFLSYSKGSAGEVRSQLSRALDLNYITPEEHKVLIELAGKIERQRMGLIKYLKNTTYAGSIRKTE